MDTLVSSFKIVVLGDCNVGKTTLIRGFTIGVSEAETKDKSDNVEDSFSKLCKIDGHSCLLHILDTSGNFINEDVQPVQSQWNSFDGVVMALSSTSSIASVRSFVNKIRSNSEKGLVPIVIACIEWKELSPNIERDEVEQLSNELGCKFYEVSLSSQDSVAQPFHGVVRLIQGIRSSSKEQNNNNDHHHHCNLQ